MAADRIKLCWRDAGLTAQGARLADAALPHALAALDAAESDPYILRAAVDEAIFRRRELRRRRARQQARYLRENGATRGR